MDFDSMDFDPMEFFKSADCLRPLNTISRRGPPEAQGTIEEVL